MSIQAISDIQDVERQAEEIRKDARKTARDNADALRAEAKNKAALRAADERSQLAKAFADAEAAVKTQIQVLDDENKSKCQDISTNAEAKLAEAQSFILERTVKHYGSR